MQQVNTALSLEYGACGRVRLMLLFVATACLRLAIAPADTHMSNRTWSWAKVVMERVNGDGASVLCHLIADADAVNKG